MAEESVWSSGVGITVIILIIIIALVLLGIFLYVFYFAPRQFGSTSSTSSSTSSTSSTSSASSASSASSFSSLVVSGPLTVGGLSTLNGGVILPTVNADGALASNLNYFSIDLPLTLPLSSLAVNFGNVGVSFSRIGNICTIVYPDWVGSMTNTAGAITISGIPPDLTTPFRRFFTAGTYSIQNIISHAYTVQNGALIVELDINNTMVLYPVNTTQFGGGNLGNQLIIPGFCVQYPLGVSV
jgi:hypothetical protein